MSSYAYAKIKLRAVIGEVEFRDVCSCSLRFGLNGIPQGSLTVAVGRDVKTNRTATIHRARKAIKASQLVEVFLTVEAGDSEGVELGLPVGETKIFLGKVGGVGYQRSGNAFKFSIQLIHWLSELNNASAISASSHPGNPADLTYPAIFKTLGPSSAGPDTGGASASDPAWVPTVDEELASVANLSDIWGNILHKWLEAIASDDPFELALNLNDSGGNTRIKEAVARLAPNDDGEALELETEGANEIVISEGIRRALINEVGGNWVNTTLWGKLVGEWAPSYWFSVVPRVTDALIVPFTGGLRGEPWKTITTSDYDTADVQAALNQVLRAIGIVHPVMFSSGLDMSKGAIGLDRGGCAGWFQPDDVDTGVVLLKDAPNWLSDPIVPSSFTPEAQGVVQSGGGGNGAPIGTVLDDDVGAGDNKDEEVRENQKTLRGVLDNYCHQWYALEMLRDRVGEIAGKLRFDIAPGSNVKIEAGVAKNLTGDQLNEDIYATVVQVYHIIDAENRKAGTGFSIAHVRSPEENSTDSTSVEKPPMYSTAWRGASLLATAAT